MLSLTSSLSFFPLVKCRFAIGPQGLIARGRGNLGDQWKGECGEEWGLKWSQKCRNLNETQARSAYGVVDLFDVLLLLDSDRLIQPLLTAT